MRVGVVIGDSDVFFRDLRQSLSESFAVEVFAPRHIELPLLEGRVNRAVLQLRLSRFMSAADVVFFEWAGELLAFASQLPNRCPVVTRLHSYELYDWAGRVDWAFVDRVILVSEAMRRRFVDSYPERMNQTVVVNYGKDLSRFQPARRGKGNVVGMLCGLVPIKRVYEAILAVAEARARGADLRLRVGGTPRDGADNVRYHKAMLRLVEREHLSEVVEFTGHVTNPAEWLSGIDVFLSNSYWEGQQNALLEAMATACPCLAHNWDGVDEVLPPTCIANTDSALVEALVAFVAMSAVERARWGEAMRAIAEERFDLRREVAEISAILRETAA